MFFAGSGTSADTLATLHAARAWAEERDQGNAAVASAHLAGRAPFQERVAQTALVGRFLTDCYRLVATWAEWAEAVVRQWPDDPADATPAPSETAETLRRASWSD
ncbi:hypothetical protein OG749_39975 [Streptomyces nojiriensis]|uniref:hypothetical protein n=1 Tax=Streptomyces nojiriensis TaxID=66374 RepID=UPI002E19CEE7